MTTTQKTTPKEFKEKIKHYRDLVTAVGGTPASRNKLSEEISKNIFSPGIYFIGELNFREEDLTNMDGPQMPEGYSVDRNGVYEAGRGSLYANIDTCWGDGSYLDNQGNEYGIDSGSIGCISIQEIEVSDDDLVAIFPKPFTVNYDKNTGIIRFGSLFIDTDFVEIGNREIYFYDPGNTYEATHPANNDNTTIDVQIVEYSKVKDLESKTQERLNWSLINFIKKRACLIDVWGNYKTIEGPTDNILISLIEALKEFDNDHDSITSKSLAKYIEAAKKDPEGWAINLKKNDFNTSNNITNNTDYFGRKAKPVKTYFDANVILKNIDFKRINLILELSLDYLINKTKSNYIDFSKEERLKRVNAFWEKENARNNFAKAQKNFEDLHGQSVYEDWEEFMDHYLIDLYNQKDKLSSNEFTDKVLEFYLIYNEEIEYFTEDIPSEMIHKYREKYHLSIRESFLIDEFVEKLPCERYLEVMNYFNKVILEKYPKYILNKQPWEDDYDKDEYDLNLIKEARFALWNNLGPSSKDWQEFCEASEEQGLLIDGMENLED